MLNINNKIVIFGVGLCAFVLIGLANEAERTLAHHLHSEPHLGLGLAIGFLYFHGVTRLSKSKHNAAIATTLGFAITGYVAIAAFLLSFVLSLR